MIDEELVWVEDREWRVPSRHLKCRWGGRWSSCPNPPVADLERRTYPAGDSQWWAYCGEHLFGRRLRDGKVELAVRRDSPAAQRGFVD